VAAALPWLRSAHRVHVLEAVDPARPAEPGELDIAHYLQFHGSVPALHRLRSSAADMGDTLLSLAADVDADLLVMGCYGHSRAREFVLGGASRTVLRTMTLPVLMAH
jgi:nucleotide-binding universal stress UspA family protein